MSAWAVKDAAKSWETVFDRAWAGEPQFVSRGGEQTVVVVSLRSFEPMKPKRHAVLDALVSCPCKDDELAVVEDRGEFSKRSLYETLRSCPFGGVELKVERDHSTGRPVELA